MKKLFFIALLSFGLFTVSNAQFLTYNITNYNNAGVTWDVGMAHAGSTTATYELNILPTQTRAGVISSYAFPFEFKCQDSNGCGTSQFVPTTTTGVGVPINNCAVPTGIKYRLELVVPFVVWEFELKLG